MGKRANELKKRKRQNANTPATQHPAVKSKITHVNDSNGHLEDGQGRGDLEMDEGGDVMDAEFDLEIESAVTILQDLVEHSEKLMDKRLKVLKGAVWDLHRVMIEKAGVGECGAVMRIVENVIVPLPLYSSKRGLRE